MALYFRKQDLSCAGAFLFKGTLISEGDFQFGTILEKMNEVTFFFNLAWKVHDIDCDLVLVFWEWDQIENTVWDYGNL